MAFRRCSDSPPAQFGRRRFFSGVLGFGVTVTHASRIFAATEFWNAKDPSTWSEEEITILTSKSPWVRLAVAAMKGMEDPTGAGNGRGPREKLDDIIIRWESAQPIRDALRAPLPAEFDGHYVVSATNLPIANPRRPGRGNEADPDDIMDRLQNGATLRTRSKGPAEAGIARRSQIGSILFGFSKDSLPLAPSDRDIVFTLEVKQMTIKAKFDAKEMIYHGKLAV
jgi:hypothetical protein